MNLVHIFTDVYEVICIFYLINDEVYDNECARSPNASWAMYDYGPTVVFWQRFVLDIDILEEIDHPSGFRRKSMIRPGLIWDIFSK